MRNSPFFFDRVSLNASNIFRKFLAVAMLVQIPSCVSVVSVTVFLSIFFSTLAESEEVPPPLPTFAFSWLDDKETFAAGDIATIKIKVLGNFNNDADLLIHGHFPNLTLTVNGKKGNSSFISGVSSALLGDSSKWNISFIPISIGTFNVLIDDERFKISDSSLHFQVLAGRMYPSVCVASWRGLVNEFVAGTIASVLILPKDAFGNNVSSTSEEPHTYRFMVSAFYENGSIRSVLNVSHRGWNGFGYVGVDFIASTTGNFQLHIAGGSQTLIGTPLPFKVKPGLLDIKNCLAKWNYDTNALQIFSKLEIFIHQQDQFGNLVPGLYEFDAQVVEKGTKLPIPIADLYFKEVAPGIQLFSFSVIEPGDFVLTVFDMKQNQSISNMPYHYTVFVGYCDGVNSVVNGSGLASSIAGIASSFSVYLEDMYHNPSPVEAERLRVQIIRNSDAYNVLPSIFPKQIVEGNRHRRSLSYAASGINGSALAPSFDPKNTSGTDLKVQSTSAFDVIYIPEKSGRYEIRVFCGNIPLNGGRSYTMEVIPGDVDMELSEVMQFVPKVPKLVRNEIVVQLMDSFSNPIPLQQTKLSLEFRSVNNSGILLWTFEDNKDGLYIGYYLAKDIGAYEICISFDGKHLSPCPFWAYVYSSEYFPKAYDDTISVWEDESVSFDALQNDYFAGGSANIIESSMPNHGSLLEYGRLFRYTPHKGFFGNDSFSYTISDINNNSVSGTAIISVLITPPQFVSLPVQLQATEDVISPRFGGFPGFEIQYSDSIENISVTLTALSGTVFLSPMLMQFWQPTWSELVVDRGENEGKGLIIVGCIEVINSALQSIQYLGNENFYGNDVIKASTMNKNGIHDTHVPLFVEPINDPPYIHVPEFIILEKGSQYSSKIFDEQRDKFEFLIGDPDMLNFPGSESQFMITLSLEVDAGILMTSLPAVFVNTTELKLKNSYQWQPLQTFVTISKHFAVKGKGIRFRGTMKDCNSAMQHLSYQGGEHGAVLTVTVNDMGNYGCYHPDCPEKLSSPLFTEANVNLIRRKPMSSKMAHTLGSVIVIEFFTIFFFGALLLFFICKCAMVLSNERRSSHTTRGSELLSQEKFQKPSSPTTPSENVTYFTGCCSSPFWLRRQTSSNFRQQSRRKYGIGEVSKHPSQGCSDHCQLTPLNNLTPLAIEKGQKETV